MIDKINIEDAVEILNKNISSLEYETVGLLDGLGKALVNDIYSSINNPPFNKSAMDGYAVKISNNNKLKVVGCIYAGESYKGEIKENEAVKIMTGAPIPKGAEAVIKKEDVTIYDDEIILNKELIENENICLIGEDIKINDKILEKNKILDYADIGLIASSGINKVLVYKKPMIGLITTGDELYEIGQPLVDAKVFNSNKYSIISRLKELGYEVQFYDHAKDNIEGIAKVIANIKDDVDVILTTGGVSVGDKDYMNQVIEALGGEILFWKINMKPGSAIMCSLYQNKLIISLSGNPTAALTTFELLARPSLDKLSGKGDIYMNYEKAILLNDYNKKSFQRRYLRGKLMADENGQYVEIVQKKSGNGMLSSAINSNCLIEIMGDTDGLKAGSVVKVIRL